MRGYQKPVLTSTAVDDLTVSAPQLGKTTMGQLWLLAAAFMHGKDLRPWWWAAPSYYQAKHGFNGFCAMARSAGVLRSATYSVPMRAELTCGAIIEARSWDNPNGMYGPSVLGCVVDEFCDLTDQAYMALSSRRQETIKDGYGHYRYLGNVRNVGGPAERLWQMAESGEAGFACRSWTWRDRAAAFDDCKCDAGRELDDADKHADGCGLGRYLKSIARERARLSEPQFRQMYGAEWLDWNLLPVYQFDRSIHVRNGFEVQRVLPLEISCDFNVDPMAWTIGQHQGNEAWAIDEVVIPGGATTEDACREVIRRYPDRKLDVVVYGDASGKARKTSASRTDYQIIQQRLGDYYRTLRLAVPAANPRVADRVNAVNALLKPADGSTPRYYVHPRCIELAKDYARVSWKRGTRDIDKSDKSRTHFTDSDGYRLASLFPVGRNRVVSVGYSDDYRLPADSMSRVEF